MRQHEQVGGEQTSLLIKALSVHMQPGLIPLTAARQNHAVEIKQDQLNTLSMHIKESTSCLPGEEASETLDEEQRSLKQMTNS